MVTTELISSDSHMQVGHDATKAHLATKYHDDERLAASARAERLADRYEPGLEVGAARVRESHRAVVT